MPKKTRLGKLKPQHKFFLNPYEDVRFSTCPECDRKTRIRKRPFLIHIDPMALLVLNMSGPYCPNCDLVILHQDKLETLLVHAFQSTYPELIGNEYLVLGTIERTHWRSKSRGQADDRAVFDHLHDFKQVVIYEPSRWVWVPDTNQKPDTTT